MPLTVWIQDPLTGRTTRVTDFGQLVVASKKYDESVFKELAEDNTAYNFYGPKKGERFVITGLRAKADQGVNPTTDAVVIIYEASADDATTVDKVLHQEAMVKGDQVTMVGMNLQVSSGKYVNAKTSDDDIHMTIFGYYV